MKPEDVMRHPLNVLTHEQRLRYFRDGYLVLPDYVPAEWLAKLVAAADDLIEGSRKVTQSDGVYTLDEGHSAETPRLQRVTSPQDHHPVIWDFIRSDAMVGLVADAVGPDANPPHAKSNATPGKSSRRFQ